MKKYIALMLILLMIPIRANAENDIKKMNVTCYVLNGTTYSGTKTRPGVCAVDKSHIGQIAVVYLIDEDGSIGECIGEYQCEDTGSASGIVNGYTIDLWRANMTQAKHTMALTKGKVYVQFIEGEG